MKGISLQNIVNFLQTSNIDKADKEVIKIINSVWEKSDTEDENGNKVADGKLSLFEKAKFLVLLRIEFKDKIGEIYFEILNKVQTLFNETEKKSDNNYYKYECEHNTLRHVNGNKEDSYIFDSNGDIKHIFLSDDSAEEYENGVLSYKFDAKTNKSEYYYTEGDGKGNIKSVKQGDKCEEYYRNGKLAKKTYHKNGDLIEERYHEDGELVGKFIYNGDSNILKQRFFYKNGKSYLCINFDENGVVTDFNKNTKVLGNDFDESKLDGSLNNDFKQGLTGICYIATTLGAYLDTPNGQELINSCINYDEKQEIGTVTLKGFNKTYIFSKEEICNSMTRLGTGDPDFVLLVLGFEKYLSEEGKGLDGGTPSLFQEAITGNAGNEDVADIIMGMYIDNLPKEVIDHIEDTKKDENGVVLLGTKPELTQEVIDKGLHPTHGYYVKAINDDGTYTVTDKSWQIEIKLTEKEILTNFFSCNYNTIQ